MLDVFLFSLRVTVAYSVNGILYSLKHMPLIGKFLPGNLYDIQGFKTFAQIVSILKEIALFFMGKLLYFLVFFLGYMAVLNILFELDFDPSILIHVYFFLALLGSYSNNSLVDPQLDQYYTVFLMRVDAKNYLLSKYIHHFTSFKILRTI